MAKWLIDGDHDIKYYHIKTVQRIRGNKIFMIEDEYG